MPPTEPVIVEQANYSLSDAPLTNPERGFYAWSQPVTEISEVADFAAIRDSGRSLAFAYLLLDAYTQTPISEAYLDKLSATFAAARAAGVKLILRVTYDIPGTTPAGTPEVTLERALSHLGQLKPVLAAEADTLAVMQAGIIGPWGEWHSASEALSTRTARNQIVMALMDAVPDTVFVQLRTPAFMMEQSPVPAGPADWYSTQTVARLAHHNDCFLASADDMGTYFPPERADAFRTYLHAASRYGPVGGETCQAGAPSQRSDCQTALAELERFHWTFLNRDYDTAILDRWRREGCYAEIENRLGYRLALTAARLTADAGDAGSFGLELDMVNSGWAAVHGPRKVVLVLEAETGETRSLELGSAAAPCDGCPSMDARRWLPGPGEVVTRRFVLAPEAPLAPGRYRLALALPDPSPRLADRPEYAIGLANRDMRDPDTGRHDLGLVLEVPLPLSPVS